LSNMGGRLATGDWRLATGDWRLATGEVATMSASLTGVLGRHS